MKGILNSTISVLVISLFLSCAKKSNTKDFKSSVHVLLQNQKVLDSTEMEYWYYKDIFLDSIPGISLDRTYSYILNSKKTFEANEVIVAVIDMAIEIDHVELSKAIWTNEDEIAGNSIDDDGNGYVDDVHGWNFLGKSDGSSIEFMNYEYTRILKKYKDYYLGKKDTSNLGDIEIGQYRSALEKYQNQYKYALSELKMEERAVGFMRTLDSTMRIIFKDKAYTTKMLDSILPFYQNEPTISTYIANKKAVMEHGVTDRDLQERLIRAKERLNKLLNLEFDDRVELIDDSGDINDIGYGNSIVNNNVKRMSHGTTIGGVIAANRLNDVGIMGISDHIKLMPIVISGYGDENDKDLTLAIRYAVDNGAEIINISSGKGFSMNRQWVLDAIKYAEENDVLIVHSAGNYSSNIDEKETNFFPNDIDENQNEVANNFINVGASTYHLNESLIASMSNYGIANVDIFAPGEAIMTIDIEKDSYKKNKGTSLSAAMVSGVAGLIKSYFPELSASEIKQVLLESGIFYHIDVKTGDGKKVPFTKLSKSGKIVNAYQAFLLAEQLTQ